MSDQRDNENFSHLSEVNEQLTRSLKRCRVLVEDCRAALAANSNELEHANEDGGEADGRVSGD